MGFREAFQTFPTIETERLILRQITPEDAEDYLKVHSDPIVIDGFDSESPGSVDKMRKHIQQRSNALKGKQMLTWGIAKKREDIIIGACWFGDFEYQSRAEIAYLLLSDFFKQGIMTEALKPVVAFGLEKMELHRIQAFVRPDNVASFKTIEKVGFQAEGCLREYKFSKRKGWMDMNVYSRLKDD